MKEFNLEQNTHESGKEDKFETPTDLREVFQTEEEKKLWDSFFMGQPLTSTEEDFVINNQSTTSRHLEFASTALSMASLLGRNEIVEKIKGSYLSTLSTITTYLKNDPDHSVALVEILDEIGYRHNDEFAKLIYFDASELRVRIQQIQKIINEIRTSISAIGKQEDVYLVDNLENISSRLAKLYSELENIQDDIQQKEKVERIVQRLEKLKNKVS